MVVSLHRGCESPGLDAKEEEIDVASFLQGCDDLLGLFYGADERIGIHL